MFGPVRTLTTLAVEAAEAALFCFNFDAAADALWAAAGRPSMQRLLEEIAGHTGATAELLKDTRNLIQQDGASAAPGDPIPGAAALQQPVNSGIHFDNTFAGTVGNDPQKCLHVAADGLRDWAAGEPCAAVHFFAAVAETLDKLADPRQAFNSTK